MCGLTSETNQNSVNIRACIVNLIIKEKSACKVNPGLERHVAESGSDGLVEAYCRHMAKSTNTNINTIVKSIGIASINKSSMRINDYLVLFV